MSFIEKSGGRGGGGGGGGGRKYNEANVSLYIVEEVSTNLVD